MTDPVRVGVVGLGYWGPNLVRNLYEIPNAELVAICDSNESRLSLVGGRYPSVRGTTSYSELVADPAIEAILIATPVVSHYALGMEAIAAGKHIFIEKPLAASAREASQLASTASEAGLTIMPGHTFLYSPPVIAIRELIQTGELGDLQFISSSRVNLGLHQSDVSVVWDLAPHDFSILRCWLGCAPTRVSATARACIVESIPDVAFINLEYESGTIAHVELSWLAPSKLRRTTIVGSKKMVVYDDSSSEPVRIFDSGVELKEPASFGEYRLTYRTGDIVSPRIDASEPLTLQLEDFCTSIRSGSSPRSSIELGLEVVGMMEAADLSLARGGVPVELAEVAAAAADGSWSTTVPV